MDLQIAQLDKLQYDDARPESWHKNVWAYMTGRHIDLKPFLDWAESRGTKRISFEDLEAMGRVDGVMVDFDPIQCYTEMWSWLNLTLCKSIEHIRTLRSSMAGRFIGGS